ncbi:hypothetical protein ACFL27_14970 [candidate division CSSED10-310 bacterium]|uniref:Uncharacterized protein n=1 Tax=candidate division CSSED10-310 bacterium TaxID=2855610 RepID=A0ABV6YZ69_UNCC1
MEPKKYIYFVITVWLTCLLICFLVFSCADDDDTDDGNNNGSSATPTPTPGSTGNDKIYYNRSTVSGGVLYSNIYAMNIDGSDKRQLTNMFPYTALDPALSNDGQSLAFTSNFESFKSVNYYDIFTLQLSDQTLKRITGNEYIQVNNTGKVNVTVNDKTNYGMNPSAIMVSYQGCDNFKTLNSNWKVTLNNVPAGNTWVKVVFNRHIGGYKTVTVPVGGTTSVSFKLNEGNFLASQAAWFFDGSKIAGVSGYAYYAKNSVPPEQGFDKIGVWASDGSFVDDLQNGTGYDLNPVFSPGGNYLAYSRGPITRESIVLVPGNNLNGSKQVIAEGGYDTSTIISYGYTMPDWSPQGNTIACTYTLTNANGDLNGNIVLINRDGSGSPVAVTAVASNALATSADFNHDGTWITYTLITSKGTTLNVLDILALNFTSDIYIVPSTGGTPTRVTTDGVSGSSCW